MHLEPVLQRLVDHILDHRTHFRRDELVFCLRGEFRIGDLHRQHGGQALTAIVTGEVDFFLAGGAAAFGILRHLSRQSAAEAREMRAAVALRDVVGEAEHVLVVTVVPPQGGFDSDAVALDLDRDRRRNERGLVTVEIFHERLDAALVAHLLALLDRIAHVGENDQHAGIEEREFAQTVLERREIELDHGEGLRGGQEGHFRSRLAFRLAGHFQRRLRDAVAEFHRMFFAVAPDRELEGARQRVHDRDADAVQAAGHLVRVLVEFSARMQLGHDDLGRRHAFALMDVDRNAAPAAPLRPTPAACRRTACGSRPPRRARRGRRRARRGRRDRR